VREAVAAGFGIGVVFESELGNDARFSPVHVADADLTVGEYVVCLEERRRLALVRTFIDIAAQIATGGTPPAAKERARRPSGE
jgi:DNA-binding transcriptional LysR family regulator